MTERRRGAMFLAALAGGWQLAADRDQRLFPAVGRREVQLPLLERDFER
jgi:hypothetical protein